MRRASPPHGLLVAVAMTAVAVGVILALPDLGFVRGLAPPDRPQLYKCAECRVGDEKLQYRQVPDPQSECDRHGLPFNDPIYER